jgi:hypothetical protein
MSSKKARPDAVSISRHELAKLRAEASQACQLLRETWDDLDHLKDECLRLGIPIGPTRKRVMQTLRVVETPEDAYERLSGSTLRPKKRTAPATGDDPIMRGEWRRGPSAGKRS